MPRHRALAACLLALALVACGGVSPGPGQDLIRSELFFGRARPDGTPVSAREWQAFLAEHVTPRFPDGLTVLHADGQYRDRTGRVVKEETTIVLILHAPTADRWDALEEIRAAYKRLFEQESVLLVTAPARVAF